MKNNNYFCHARHSSYTTCIHYCHIFVFFSRILFCSIKDDAAVVVFVSKMIPVRLADVSKRDIVVLKNNRREQRKRDGGR